MFGSCFINDCLPQPTLHFSHPLLQFADITDPFLSTDALFSRFYSHRIQTWAVKVMASYLAIWIVRFHVQYDSEIGSNCDFQVSQGSVATQLRWGGMPCNSYTENFLRNLPEKTILKISLHLRKLWSKVKCIFETQCSGLARPTVGRRGWVGARTMNTLIEE